MINLKSKDWKLENINTVLFDKDGTFIDLHYFWGKMTELRAAEIIKRYRLNETLLDKLCLLLGYDRNSKKMLSDGITALYSRVKIIEIFKNDLIKLGINISTNELTNIFDLISETFYKEIHKYTKPIQPAIELIKQLRLTGVKLGVVTSDSVKSTQLTLQNFGWESLFDTIIGRESSTHTKESGELTKLALKNLNADPKTTIMIGDAPMDLISAQNAGIEKTILVATGQIKLEELLKISNYSVNSLEEIKINNLTR